MNIRDLHYFIHLSKSLSFTKTAEAFFVSQPSISIALKRLEEHFGATLIERQRSVQNIHLTPAGEILLRRAQEIIDLLELTEREIEDNQNESIIMGYSSTISSYYLPDILAKIDDFAKSMNFVEEESSDKMLEMLEKQQVSVAILGSEDPNLQESWLETIKLDSFLAGIYVAKDHPLKDQELITAEELSNHSLISLGQGFTHYRILKTWAEEVGYKLKDVNYTADTHTLNMMVANNLKVGFMTDVLVTMPDQIRKIPIESAPSFHTYLVINKEMKVSDRQAAFNDALRKVAKGYA